MALLLLGCAQYRSYPLLTLEPDDRQPQPLELSGLALLPDGRAVIVAEGVHRSGETARIEIRAVEVQGGSYFV